jgi:hypothetical protein
VSIWSFVLPRRGGYSARDATNPYRRRAAAKQRQVTLGRVVYKQVNPAGFQMVCQPDWDKIWRPVGGGRMRPAGFTFGSFRLDISDLSA